MICNLEKNKLRIKIKKNKNILVETIFINTKKKNLHILSYRVMTFNLNLRRISTYKNFNSLFSSKLHSNMYFLKLSVMNFFFLYLLQTYE